MWRSESGIKDFLFNHIICGIQDNPLSDPFRQKVTYLVRKGMFKDGSMDLFKEMGNDRIQPGTKREQATTLESGSGYYLSRIVQRLGGSIRQEANKYGTAKS